MLNKKLILIGVAILAVAVILIMIPKLFFKTGKTNDTKTTTTTTQVDTTNTTTNTTTTTDQTDITSAFPLPTVTATNLSKQARKEYEFAASKAIEWRKDSVPVAVKVTYTKSIDPKNGKNTYIFVSPSLNQYYFTLTFNQAQNEKGTNIYERALYFKEDYFLSKNTTNMPIKYWKLDYIEALKKADASGGKDIRANNKEYDINMVLSAEDGKYLMWKTEYLVAGKQAYSISYNAYTGEMM